MIQANMRESLNLVKQESSFTIKSLVTSEDGEDEFTQMESRIPKFDFKIKVLKKNNYMK